MIYNLVILQKHLQVSISFKDIQKLIDEKNLLLVYKLNNIQKKIMAYYYIIFYSIII